MKRIGIFSFYDKEGIVDSYIEFLLQELISVVDRLIIVVNGCVDEKGHQLFENYSREIIVRENTGFDAGAYADIILNYLPQKELEEYDELVLCNDTFYGPFVSMRNIFFEMEKKECDFWGLNIVDRGLLNYIQSYFLVFKKPILTDVYFVEYIKNNIDMNETDITNVYGIFEVGLFYELIRLGYKYSFYTNTNLHNLYSNPYTSMKTYGLPILKKKSLGNTYTIEDERLQCLKYVLWNTDYKIEFILENVNRVYGWGLELSNIINFKKEVSERECKIGQAIVTEQELLDWVGEDDFYIYGAGTIARMLYFVYLNKKKNCLGFLVSDNQKMEQKKLFNLPIVKKSCINQRAKVVIGVSNALTEEIQRELGVAANYLYLWK